MVVELKARFDEAANIQFAEQLEEYGIHVTYGVVGLKTHCKVILVVRQDLRRPAPLRACRHRQLPRGHRAPVRRLRPVHQRRRDRPRPDRAVQLPDHRLSRRAQLHKDPAGADAAEAARCSRRSSARSRSSAAGSPGLIQLKMNALEDVDITRALYRAAQAGVKIDLIVRDTCRLRPGIPGLSESVRVVSVVGRFLEHGRIYYFRNGGAEEYFIGSADCMKRNLESRVEAVAPVEDPTLRKRTARRARHAAQPNHAARGTCSSDGSYVHVNSNESCQQTLIDLTEKEQRHRRRRSRGYARRSGPQ